MPTDDIKDSMTEWIRPKNGCTINPHVSIAVTSNAENGESSESSKLDSYPHG